MNLFEVAKKNYWGS